MPTLIVGCFAAKACRMMHALQPLKYTHKVSFDDYRHAAVWFDSSEKYAAWIRDGMPPHPDANEWIKEGFLAYAILTVETELLMDPAKSTIQEVSIDNFEVPPSHRGKGIGMRAVIQLLTLLKAMKVTRVDLVSEYSARGFWRRAGFHIKQGREIILEISLQTQRFPASEKPEMLTATGLRILMAHDAQDGMCKDLPGWLDRHRNAYAYANKVLETPSSIIAWMEGKNLVAYAAICSPAEELMDPTVQTSKEIMSIKYFEVVPDKRRQGFGKAIIDDLLERAKTKLRCISLIPLSESKSFWTGRGWEEDRLNTLSYHFVKRQRILPPAPRSSGE